MMENHGMMKTSLFVKVDQPVAVEVQQIRQLMYIGVI